MFLFLGLVSVVSSASANRPHICLFLADDYGFADASYHTQMYGNSSNVVATPAIDRLAYSGIRLENYYVQPVCSPTRATIMTGRYVIHTGIHTALVDSSTSALGIDEVTLAQKLREAGYATEAVGKWHLGFKSWKYTPQERGFDNFFGYYAGSQDYWNHQSLCWAGGINNGCFQNSNNGDAVTGVDLHRNRESILNNTQYSTILYTDVAKSIINEHAQKYILNKNPEDYKPLFLYLPHQAVHVGNKPEASHPEYALNQAPQWAIDKYSWVSNIKRRNLSAMITVMDDAVNNVTEELKKAGMWDNTIFIFSTDNGGPLPDMASNYPLRGGKAQYWEGGLRGVGFIASGNFANVGIKMAPYINRELIHVSDWLPTLCEVAGCKLNGTKPLDGVSAWGTISRNESSKRDIIVHDICTKEMGGSCPGYRIAIRSGEYKYIIGQNGMKNISKAELYNVVKDVSETDDVADKNPELMAHFEQVLIPQYMKTTVPASDRDPVDPNSNPQKHGGVWVPWMD